MSKPIVADNKPAKVSLEKGKQYFFCACGRSADQPFCDGSHTGTEFSPKALTAEESGIAFLCQCKHAAELPFCDGSHKQFSDEQVGAEGPGVEGQA